MLTSITVSERAPPASSVSPAPMLALSPAASPSRRSGSSRRRTARRGRRCRMNPGSSALTVLSRSFFDVLHCHAPPVSTSASTAINAAASARRAASGGGISLLACLGGPSSVAGGVLPSRLRRGRAPVLPVGFRVLEVVVVGVVGVPRSGSSESSVEASRPGSSMTWVSSSSSLSSAIGIGARTRSSGAT